MKADKKLYFNKRAWQCSCGAYHRVKNMPCNGVYKRKCSVCGKRVSIDAMIVKDYFYRIEICSVKEQK